MNGRVPGDREPVACMLSAKPVMAGRRAAQYERAKPAAMTYSKRSRSGGWPRHDDSVSVAP